MDPMCLPGSSTYYKNITILLKAFEGGQWVKAVLVQEDHGGPSHSALHFLKRLHSPSHFPTSAHTFLSSATSFMPSAYHFPEQSGPLLRLTSSGRPAWVTRSDQPSLCSSALMVPGITWAPLPHLLNVARYCDSSLWWHPRGQKMGKMEKDSTPYSHSQRGNAFLNCT